MWELVNIMGTIIVIVIVIFVVILLAQSIININKYVKDRKKHNLLINNETEIKRSYKNCLSSIYDELTISDLNKAYELLKMNYEQKSALNSEETKHWTFEDRKSVINFISKSNDEFLDIVNNKKWEFTDKNGKYYIYDLPRYPELDIDYIRKLLNKNDMYNKQRDEIN